MKQTKLYNIPDEGNEHLAKSPVVLQRELDAERNSRPSGKSGWIVGGLPGISALPSEEERQRRRAKRLNGNGHPPAAK